MVSFPRSLLLVLVSAMVGFALGRLVLQGGRDAGGVASESSKVMAGAEEQNAPQQSGTGSLAGKAKAGAAALDDALPAGAKAVDSAQLAKDLESAYGGGDSLASATKAFAIISKLSRADFEKWALEPARFPAPPGMYLHRDPDLADAIANAMLERWFTVDPTGALAAIAKVERAQLAAHLGSSGELFKALARSHPELRLSLPDKSPFMSLDRSTPVALRSLAAKDPAAARAYLDRLSEPFERNAAEIAIAQGVADHDPIAGVRLAEGMKDRDVFMTALHAAEKAGEARFREALATANGTIALGNEAAEFILRHPNLDWENLLKGGEESSPGATMPSIALAEQLTPEECVRRLGTTSRLPDSVREKVEPLLVKSWAIENPKAAAKWAYGRANASDPSPGSDDSLTAAIVTWMRADKTAALAWFSQLPDSAAQRKMSNDIAVQFAMRDDLPGALSFFHPDVATQSSLTSIVGVAAGRNPAAAAQWITALPPELDAKASIEKLLHSWLSSDPTAAADWVEALPPGKRREGATEAYIREAAQLDPAVAAASCEHVSDPKTRQNLAENTYRAMLERNPDAARAWIQSLAGMDAAWKDRVIRLLR